MREMRQKMGGKREEREMGKRGKRKKDEGKERGKTGEERGNIGITSSTKRRTVRGHGQSLTAYTFHCCEGSNSNVASNISFITAVSRPVCCTIWNIASDTFADGKMSIMATSIPVMSTTEIEYKSSGAAMLAL